MNELQELKAMAYDLMLKIQNDQIKLQNTHNKIAELSQVQSDQQTKE